MSLPSTRDMIRAHVSAAIDSCAHNPSKENVQEIIETLCAALCYALALSCGRNSAYLEGLIDEIGEQIPLVTRANLLYLEEHEESQEAFENLRANFSPGKEIRFTNVMELALHRFNPENFNG